MANERTATVDYGEVWIDGYPYKLAKDVSFEKTNIFGRKQNQGDPGPDDHPTFSTSIQRDWSGGALVKDYNSSSDTSKFYFSTAETQYPGYIGLPPETRSVGPPVDATGTPWIIGDYMDDLYVVWADKLYRVHPETMDHTFVGDLPSPAAGPGTVYKEQADTSQKKTVMFIPLTGGYVTYHTTDGIVEGPASTFAPVAFEVWDDKVFRLDTDGSLRWSNDVPATDDDWVFSAGIPDGTNPRGLISYKDNQSNPCLFLITDGTTWKHDFANNILHKDDLWFPRHPNHGLASTVHQGSSYISVGTGIHRYDNQTITPAGLDNRDGLPARFRGAIVSMASGYNGMYALLAGRLNTQASEPESTTLELGGGDDQMYLSASESHNLLMIQNPYGWHYRWDSLGTRPTNVLTSNTKGTYNLWWGSGGKLYTQTLSSIYFNPADPATTGYPYAPIAEHISGQVNWNWVGQTKIMKQIEIDARKLNNGAYIEVYYRVDSDSAPWIHIGTADQDGEYRWYVGQDIDEPWLKNGRGKYRGVRHEWFQLRFLIHRGSDINESPYIRWHSVIARRWLRPQRMWRMSLDLTSKTKDHPVEEQRKRLNAIADKQEAVVFEHNDEHFMVEMILLGANQKSGRDESNAVSVTLLEANDLDEHGGDDASESQELNQ